MKLKSSKKQFIVGLQWLSFVFIFGSATVTFAALSAHDIMAKNDEAQKLKTVISVAKMISGGGGSTDRTKEFMWWRKLTTDNVHYNTLTRFQFPPEVKNEAILFIEDKNSTDVQMYLPTYKKVRRVETGQQSGSFMGSEFSYSDIATPHLEDFSYKLVKEEKCPNDAAVAAAVIESTPASDLIKERTGSTKIVSWVRQDNSMVCNADYYDADGKIFKKLDATSIKEVDPKLHKFMAYKMKMVSVKTGRYTSLEFDKVKVEEAIADSTFTVQNLSKEK